MKTSIIAPLVALLVLITSPTRAEVLANNLWPNPTFEEGQDLNQPTGTPAGWNRGGNDPAVCQVSPKAASPSHALAVVDNSAGYGEWYSDLSLAGKATRGDQLDLQWFEVFDIAAGNEMRVTVLFLASSDAVVGVQHYVVRGRSTGWAGSLDASPFVKRNERVAVPEGSAKLRVSLVSGGPAEGNGTMIVDDLSVALVPKPVVDRVEGNFWPNPTIEEGDNLDSSEGTPTAWKRGGNDPSICQVSTANSVSQKHSLAVIDQNADGYGEWYADFPLSGLVREGRLVNLEWFELYSVDAGEMRLSAVFLDATDNSIGAQHWVVTGQSSGWSGDIVASTFTKRNESLALPPGTRKLRLSLVSGGPSSTTGSMLIDNVSAVLAPTPPTVLFGNFWPNPAFEEGQTLDDAGQGKPTNWNRGGSDTSIGQLLHDNYNSSTHALAVVDNGNGFGEWYADFGLGDKAKPGDTLGLQWFELFKVSANGEMRLTALFFKSDGSVAGERHFVASGQSAGWSTDVPNSSFTKRAENIVVPAGATKLRLLLVSGGPGETTGLMVIDDLSVAPPPKPAIVLAGSFWPNPGFEEGAQLDNPKVAQPTAWLRGGSDVSFDQITGANWTSTAHALAVVDTREDAYGEWYRLQDLAGIVQPGQTLQAQWWWLYDTTGDMRLSFMFLDENNATLAQKHSIASGQSSGWNGSLATSSLARRVARIPVPEGAARLQVTLASGGSLQVAGTIVLDDLSLRVAPPNPDTDGDGLLDDAEEVAGTDAEDETSLLRVTGLTREADGLGITWSSIATRTYAVEFAERLGADQFKPLPGAENIPSAENEPTTSFIDARTTRPSVGFYRVKVLGP